MIWGATHDDQSNWALVAFVRRLPELTPEQYQALVATTREGHDGHHDHDQDGEEAADAPSTHGSQHTHGHDE